MNKKQYYVIAFDNDQIKEEDILKYFKIDWDEIIRRNIDSKVENIFEAMGWEFVDNDQLKLF